MPRVSDMKDRLMEAAMELMWQNSYGAASVDAICERAAAKKGSFYYFFKSKSELAAAALEADWQKKRAEMDSRFHQRFRHSSDWIATSILSTIAWRSFRKNAAPPWVVPS